MRIPGGAPLAGLIIGATLAAQADGILEQIAWAGLLIPYWILLAIIYDRPIGKKDRRP